MTAYIPFISLIRLTCVSIWQYLLDNSFSNVFFELQGTGCFVMKNKVLFGKGKMASSWHIQANHSKRWIIPPGTKTGNEKV